MSLFNQVGGGGSGYEIKTATVTNTSGVTGQITTSIPDTDGLALIYIARDSNRRCYLYGTYNFYFVYKR